MTQIKQCQKIKFLVLVNLLKNQIIKIKAKDSETEATPLCVGNISKDWPVENMKKDGLNGYVYKFSVDYDVIAVGNVLDIYKYLMKKNNMI